MNAHLKISIAICILIGIISFAPYVIYKDFYPMFSDSMFHLTLVERIKGNLPINEAINVSRIPYFVTNITAWKDNLNFQWSAGYVSLYPKLFHNLASLIPMNAKLSIGVLVSILLPTLCLIFIAIQKEITGNWKTAVYSLAIFLFVLDVLQINYPLMVIGFGMAELLFVTIGLAGFYIYIKFPKVRIIVILLTIPLLFLSHNIFTTAGILDYLRRGFPYVVMVIISVSNFIFKENIDKLIKKLPTWIDTLCIILVLAIMVKNVYMMDFFSYAVMSGNNPLLRSWW